MTAFEIAQKIATAGNGKSKAWELTKMTVPMLLTIILASIAWAWTVQLTKLEINLSHKAMTVILALTSGLNSRDS
mgnify:CR=1 FL=1